MAPGNCRQPPSKLLCMSHLKVLPSVGLYWLEHVLSEIESGDGCEREIAPEDDL